MNLAVSNDHRRWNIAAQVQQCVHFDGALALAELGPWEQGQAQIDGRRIQRINRLLEFQAEVVVGI